MRRRSLRSQLADWGMIVFFAIVMGLILALIPIGVWLQFAAPCKYVTWMPAKDVPTRCLEINVR